jgi:hypothetical protein
MLITDTWPKCDVSVIIINLVVNYKLMDYLFLSNLCVSRISLMKPVDVNPNDEWVNVSKHSAMHN